jgi:hypothetical protein
MKKRTVREAKYFLARIKGVPFECGTKSEESESDPSFSTGVEDATLVSVMLFKQKRDSSEERKSCRKFLERPRYFLLFV